MLLLWNKLKLKSETSLIYEDLGSQLLFVYGTLLFALTICMLTSYSNRKETLQGIGNLVILCSILIIIYDSAFYREINNKLPEMN